MLGNLPFFMEAEELTNYDIVSYGFDDLEGLYLRGQWTVHRNDPPGINQVSRHCSHLTTLLTFTCHTTCHTTKVVLTTTYCARCGASARTSPGICRRS